MIHVVLASFAANVAMRWRPSRMLRRAVTTNLPSGPKGSESDRPGAGGHASNLPLSSGV